MYAMPAPVNHVKASAQHSTAPRHYIVRAGDTLSGIAQARYGNPADYACIYAANKKVISNPSVIHEGDSLSLPLHGSSACAVPAPPAPVVHQVTTAVTTAPVVSAPAVHTYPEAVPQSSPAHPYYSGYPNQATAQPTAQVSSSRYTGSSGMQSCIIGRESGGNSQVMNGSGHYGLYQFSEGTWVANGGSGADFGHASVAEQNQVFDNTVASSGYSAWAAYDGC